jgi:hypothetical protein
LIKQISEDFNAWELQNQFSANICQVAKENNLYLLLKALCAEALHISVNKVMIILLKNTNLLE